MTWRPRYAVASAALMLALVGIALFVRDGFVRPFLGDALATAWLYVTARAVLTARPWMVALGVLAVAWGLEFAQYLELLRWLGLEHARLARVVLGAAFDPLDLLAYVVGVAGVMVTEQRRTSEPSDTS